jgi:hypothetical protein
LYEDDSSSVVCFTIKPWGLYENVSVSSADGKFHSTRILGKKQDCKQEAALWVCSRDMALSLAGNTRIEGPVFAPVNGVNYIQLGNTPFSGKTIANYDIHLSGRELPPADSIYLKELNALYKNEKSMAQPVPLNKKQTYYSFIKETSYFALPQKTEDLVLQGNAILYGDEVTISSRSIINDVILVARKVIVEDGFTGSMQIMASDTVILKKNVHLLYPSGIYLNGNNGKTFLNIGPQSRLDGYALINGNVDKGNTLLISPNYHQEPDAVFCGLLYVNGTADMNGIISGAAYIKECYYLPVNGIYVGTLYNVRIERGKQIVYPFFFKTSTFQRKEIKSVY